MVQRMENNLRVEIEGGTLEGAHDLEFYIKQRGGFFLQLTPTIEDETHILVTLPSEEAMKLKNIPAQVQLAYHNEKNQACATEVLTVPVKELLKEVGYA